MIQKHRHHFAQHNNNNKQLFYSKPKRPMNCLRKHFLPTISSSSSSTSVFIITIFYEIKVKLKRKSKDKFRNTTKQRVEETNKFADS